MENEKQELISKLKEQSASYKYKDEHEKYLLANKIVYKNDANNAKEMLKNVIDYSYQLNKYM